MNRFNEETSIIYQALKSLVASCMTQADQDNYHSVAFPSLGTGKLLKVSASDSCKWMVEEMINHADNNPSSAVREVVIVLYDRDHDTIRVRIFIFYLNRFFTRNDLNSNCFVSCPIHRILSERSIRFFHVVPEEDVQGHQGHLTSLPQDMLTNHHIQDVSVKTIIAPNSSLLCHASDYL